MKKECNKTRKQCYYNNYIHAISSYKKWCKISHHFVSKFFDNFWIVLFFIFPKWERCFWIFPNFPHFFTFFAKINPFFQQFCVFCFLRMKDRSVCILRGLKFNASFLTRHFLSEKNAFIFTCLDIHFRYIFQLLEYSLQNYLT